MEAGKKSHARNFAVKWLAELLGLINVLVVITGIIGGSSAICG